MSQFDSHKDYYDILGANERTTARDLERLYKRMAARRHPDRGGSEEEMKSLNEAYGVLRNATSRQANMTRNVQSLPLVLFPFLRPPRRTSDCWAMA